MRWFAVLLWLTCVSVHDGQDLQKRSDDVSLQSLSTLVQQQAAIIQQQAATIQQLQATITAVENGVSSMQTSLQTADRQLTGAVQALNTRLNTKVMFTAYMGPAPVTLGTSNSALIFDRVVTNIGGGYNSHTGVFAAPVSGLYYFNANLMNYLQHPWIQWGLAKGGSILCERHLDPSSSYDKASCDASVQLQTGETVVVQRFNGAETDQEIHGGIFCAFTGFLLSMD